MGQHNKIFGCAASSNFCVIFLAMRSHSPFGFVRARALPYSLLSWSRNTNDIFGKLFCVVETCLTIAWFPIYNVVEHRREYDSAFEIIRFPGSQECPKFSLDSDRCVATELVPIELRWSARDIMFVLECRRVSYFRKSCLIRKGVVVSPYPRQNHRTHELLFSITVRLVVPTEINCSRILCPSFAIMKIHRI